MRPLGGWLADRFGGGRITFWAFVGMALGVAAVLQCLPREQQTGSLPGFLSAFGVLFAASGIGNGSTFRMIPAIFLGERQRSADPLPSAQAQAAKDGNVEAAAVLGFASAIGAYGGFFIPKSYGTSIAMTGSPAAALQIFMLFYFSCIALTWWYYSRRTAPMPC
jgi:MFS transporter, NNP family, nitrate/nitrite transporter